MSQLIMEILDMPLSVVEIFHLSLLGGELFNPASFVITATALTSLYIYFACPRLLVQMYFRIAVRWSGMRLRRVTDDNGFTFMYGERGQPSPDYPSMLLLHGFSADHFMWAPIVHNFPSLMHVVAMDLPGHGFSSEPVSGEVIGFKGQIRRIRQFVKLIGLDQERFHITGVSMGGALSGLFAATYPELVTAVTLTCPSMKTPKEGVVVVQHRKSVEENGGRMTLETCPLLPQNGAALQAMLNVVCYHRSFVPYQILQGAVDLRKERYNFYLDLLHELLSNESQVALETELHCIQCPIQVVWGREDEIVHMSGAEVIKSKAPNLKRVDILPSCGHAINMDQPQAFASVVVQFWKALQNEDS